MMLPEFDTPDSVDTTNGLSKAEEDYLNSKTEDQRKLTKLKEEFANQTFNFLYMWFGFTAFILILYVCYQFTHEKEIPKEVIIAMFTCSAAVFALVGYILKGLFGGKDSK